MRRILVLPLALAVLVGFVRGQDSNRNEVNVMEEVKKEVLKVDNEKAQAALRVDRKVLGRIYADDVSWTNIRGQVLTKAQVLADLRSGNIKIDSVRHEDVRLRVYGNAVVLTGYSTGKSEYKGKAFSNPRRYTNVYVKQDGRWQLVVHTDTPVATQ
jgi:ketosteroid isomerase-like protein